MTSSPLASLAARPIAIVCSLVFTMAATACSPAALTQQVEARRLAADVHVEFTKAADAANRAVMADTDETAAAAAVEARQAVQAVDRDVERLQPLLKSLGFAEETRLLDAFNAGFAEYRKIDEEILPLAVENSNAKAQRLSFGPAQEAVTTFRRSLEAAVRSAPPPNMCCAEALATKAVAALLEIQVLHAPHIAEAEDAAMTRLEERMSMLEATVDKTLDELKRLLGGRASAHLTSAAAAFDQFKRTHREIISLSRRNSEVRSLALSLGRKRMLTAAADDQLRALEAALTRHEITATR